MNIPPILHNKIENIEKLLEFKGEEINLQLPCLSKGKNNIITTTDPKMILEDYLKNDSSNWKYVLIQGNTYNQLIVFPIVGAA